MYFKQGLYAGKRGRYGLAEGPEGKWCDEGKAYHSMSLHEKIHAVTPGANPNPTPNPKPKPKPKPSPNPSPNPNPNPNQITPGVHTGMIIGASSHCEAISGNVVAGYLPANPEMIFQHLGHLLEDGETVLPIPCTDHAVLWRESLMDPKRGITAGDGREGRITTLDLSPSLLGLATVFLPDKVRRAPQHLTLTITLTLALILTLNLTLALTLTLTLTLALTPAELLQEVLAPLRARRRGRRAHIDGGAARAPPQARGVQGAAGRGRGDPRQVQRPVRPQRPRALRALRRLRCGW